MIGALAVSAALAVGTSTAAAQVEVPTRAAVAGSSAGPGGNAAAPTAAAAPAAPAAPTAAAPATRARTTVALKLRLGSRGDAVRGLQRALRKRGMKIRVDGAFGARTRVAVKAVQKRFKLRATGVADTKLLKKLGLRTRTRTVASATAPIAVPGASRYLSMFPVLGDYSYFDDFGAGRHQGSHEGNDIMADKGTPVVAVADAKVDRLTRTERGLGGIYIWLERADGTEYYYAHLSSIATGLQEGHKVTAGQVIGTVGNTGDARYGAHHLHFEIRVGGTRPIDPYKHLVAVDQTRKGSASRSR